MKPAAAGPPPAAWRAIVLAAFLAAPSGTALSGPAPSATAAQAGGRPSLQATALDQVPASSFSAQVERRVLEQTNAYRRRQGLAPLVREARLDEAARGFARKLTTLPRFEHDADGGEPADRVGATGYRWCSVAENLAWQFDSRGFDAAVLAQRLVDGWIASSGHRRNLVDGRTTQIGLGVVQARDGRWFAVQVFARPEGAGPHGGCRPTGGRGPG